MSYLTLYICKNCGIVQTETNKWRNRNYDLKPKCRFCKGIEFEKHNLMSERDDEQ